MERSDCKEFCSICRRRKSYLSKGGLLSDTIFVGSQKCENTSSRALKVDDEVVFVSGIAPGYMENGVNVDESSITDDRTRKVDVNFLQRTSRELPWMKFALRRIVILLLARIALRRNIFQCLCRRSAARDSSERGRSCELHLDCLSRKCRRPAGSGEWMTTQIF